MIHLRSLLLSAALLLSSILPALAQDTSPLKIATVHRPPFAFADTPDIRGFSIDLMRAIGKDMGREVEFKASDTFGGMFTQVKNGSVDGAIANISITTEREREMDFSQPIFGSGIKILIPIENTGLGLFSALFTWDIGLVILSGLALLFFGGVLMWLFERRHQPYFDKSAREALFPSFWWALNLVVNGGFEERVPRSPFGRIFAVMLVVSSLFIVSIFVASITAAMTVNALSSNVQNLRDLEHRRVATISGSTSAAFLKANGLVYADYATPEEMFNAFEHGVADALVFDGPILAYYQQTKGAGKVRVLDRTYRPENYGIVLSSGSELKEEIDQVLLKFSVDGTYDDLLSKWFGNIYSPN
ncbi:transporter substrate-binding domain-containing protein [Planktotalea sp.]|uniref:transporter substrate-binding domain-containing protein n=1 Tax=Planktotalea sp. TaxID=2029877 RepID=UPI003D6A1202